MQIMDCLKVLSDDCSKEKLDHGLVSDLIALLHLGRRRIEKRRTLEPVCLLSEEQAEQIRKWLSIIESTVFNLLQGNIYEAFWEYDKYMEEVNSNDKTGSLRYGRYTFKSV